MSRFNYIITIHNKEELIEQVIKCVLMCCRDNSHIYPVLDGCTDRTEEIIDSIIDTYSAVPITKVYTPDVHELLSINAGLRAANQEGDGYNIVLQDDVLLADFMLENKIRRLYEWAGSKLGYVSFRLGANFTKDAASSDEPVPLTNYLENAYGHALSNAETLLPHHFAYRTVPIKSPVCFPFKLIRAVGVLDERLAPYGHDDTDYAIRCVEKGYQNAVFAIRFYSELKWGGTRETPHPKINDTLKRNMRQIREWHYSTLMKICENNEAANAVKVLDKSSEKEEQKALKYYNKTVKALKEYNSKEKNLLSLPSHLLRRLKKGLRHFSLKPHSTL